MIYMRRVALAHQLRCASPLLSESLTANPSERRLNSTVTCFDLMTCATFCACKIHSDILRTYQYPNVEFGIKYNTAGDSVRAKS